MSLFQILTRSASARVDWFSTFQFRVLLQEFLDVRTLSGGLIHFFLQGRSTPGVDLGIGPHLEEDYNVHCNDRC